MDTGISQTCRTVHGPAAKDRQAGSVHKPEATSRRRGHGTRTAITTIAVIIGLTGLAERAAADDLVTNLNENTLSASNAHKLSVNDFAMPFTTGPNASGYRLYTVSLEYTTGRVWKHDQVYVSLYANHASASYRPSDSNQVAHLTTNRHIQEGPQAGVNHYRVRSRRFGGQPRTWIHLDPITTYWIEIFAGEDATTAALAHTASANEGGETGWLIGGSVLVKPEGTADSRYQAGATPIKLGVVGTVNPDIVISVSDATASEGTDETLDFVVSLNQSWSRTVTVEYLTLAVTASPGNDYTDVRGKVTFEPGETTKIIAVPIVDDAVEDSGETFKLRLHTAVGARLASSAVTGTILNTEDLIGSFENVPAEHDGSTPFTFDAEFTTDIGISYATLRDDSFTVTEGEVNRARRNNGQDDSWEITVTPSGNDTITITLPGHRSCGTTGAICSKEENPARLSNSPSVTVAGPPGASTVPVTASFGNMPAEHNGSDFTFDLSFSENVEAGYARIRDHAFSVNGGDINQAQRKTQGSNQHWTVTVDPDDNGAITITVPETTNCSNASAICTEDRRKLNHSTSETVLGPVGIAIADAEAEEGANAVLAFAVTLSRAASNQLTISYRTSDGSATAGADYTSTSGTLTIDAGSSAATIEVPVLDDDHDEGSETFTLTLSNASSGDLTDSTATGTITNHDALPKALVARFGRTAAVHIVDQVEERVNAPRAPGFDGRVAGREINREMGQEFARDFLQQLGSEYEHGHGQRGRQRTTAGTNNRRFTNGGMTSRLRPRGGMAGGMYPSRNMEGRNPRQSYSPEMGMSLGSNRMLQGSSLALNRPTSSGGIVSFWSRSAQSQFYGQDGALALNGDVRTSMFGVDYSKGRMITGVSLSHSRGLGSYTGADTGQMTSAVTGLYPWIGYKASERFTVWTVGGYGAGGLMLQPGAGAPIETGLSMAMAAGGGRGQVLGGDEEFSLAFKADTLWVRLQTNTASGPGGNLKASTATVSRLRTAFEGSQRMTIGNRMALTPSVEIGIRQDGGDAEAGRGIDLGAGLVLADRVTGLAIDLHVRRLLVHQAKGFAESGMSISISYNPTPSTPLGFTARVSPAWGGESTSSAEALWGRETMAGMGHEGLLRRGGQRLDTEIGYGLPISSRFVGTPRAGVRTSEYGRVYRVGYGMQVLEQGLLNLQLGIDAERRETPIFHLQEQSGGTDQRVVGRATIEW